MKTFVCVKRSDQSFGDLVNVEFLFDYVDSYAANNMAMFAEKVKKVLDNSGPDDIIVFNGPTFICGIVGFYWFDNPVRKNFNVARWDVHIGRYVVNANPLGTAFD